MSIRLWCIVPSIVFSMVLAGSAVQSDWSGGPGVPGPLPAWGDTFGESVHMGYADLPGTLTLEAPLGAHLVADGIDTPVALLLADIDGDGADDAASCDAAGLSWFRNADGHGNLWEPAPISSTGAAQAWLSASDLDLDGDVDLVLSLCGNRLSWWENESSGLSWTEHVIFTGDVRESRCADFDGDGWTDVALMVPGTSDVMWWRNRLESGLAWSPNYVDGAFAGGNTCDAADFDGNGTIDIAGGSTTTGEVAVWLNVPASDGWEKLVVYDDFQHPTRVRAADIDGDGRIDLAGVCWTNSYLVWWENPLTDAWVMHTVATDMTQASAVAPVDMDGDGDTDILAAAFDLTQGLRWYDNVDGTGLSWELVEAYSCYQSRDVSIGDVNADGVPEIVAPSACMGLLRYWRTGGFETPGELVSSIFDTGIITGIDWDYLHWDALEPTGTDLRVAVRGSSDPGDMGSWSAWLDASTSLEEILDPSDRYIQYRIGMSTTEPRLSPVLNDIAFLWSSTGIGGDPQATDPLVLTGSNPAHGSFLLGVNLPTPGPAELAVFDLGGRRVALPVAGDLPAGTSSALVDGLPSGVYICTLNAPGISESLRVTVVR